MMVARRTEEGLLLRVSLERKRNRPSSFSLCRRSRRRSTSPLFLIRCRVVISLRDEREKIWSGIELFLGLTHTHFNGRVFFDVAGFWKERGDVLTCSPTGKFSNTNVFPLVRNPVNAFSNFPKCVTMDTLSNVLFLKPINVKNRLNISKYSNLMSNL